MATEKRSFLTEIPKAGVYPDIETFNKMEPERQKRDKQLITDAISESKDARQKALLNAHEALVNAFGPKVEKILKMECEAPKQHLSEDTTTVLTMDDLEKMLLDLGFELADDEMVKECRKRLDECKNPNLTPSDKDKMYRDIHRKFWAYVQSLPTRKVSEVSTPSETDIAVKKFMSGGCKSGIHWISHEGSMILCSLIAVADGDGAWINISQLPDEDREIVLGLTKKTVAGFWAEMDQYKNFDCAAERDSKGKGIEFTLGNRIASIPPNEATGRQGDVKIEKKGKDIIIGNQIKLEKNRMQNLVNPMDTTTNGVNRGGSVPRQKVSGRNAYEIRADILEMALEFSKNSGDKKIDVDDILDIAESFYSFVEHK